MSDDLLESGLASLRSASPRTSPLALVDVAKSRAQSARWIRVCAGASTLLAAGIFTFAAYRPASAKAALRSSLQYSKAVRPIHVIQQGEASDRRDIWFFPDRLLTKTAHSLSEQRFGGKGLEYVDACRDGHRFVVDYATQNFIADPDLGTIDLALELDEHQRNSHVEKIEQKSYRGGTYTDYRLTDSNPIDGSCTLDCYVDPDTNLARHLEETRVSPDGARHEDSSDVDYPEMNTANREAPRFPAGLTFRTDLEIETEFWQAMKTPEQVKTLDGVRVEFYGLALLTISAPEPHLRAFAVTRGGETPDAKQDHYAGLADCALSSHTAMEGGPNDGSEMHLGLGPPEFMSDEAIIQPQIRVGDKLYIANAANQMPSVVPREVTVRVPVWKPSGQTMVATVGEHKGKRFAGRRFVGYVSFKTRRIFCDDGSSTLDLFPSARGPGGF